VGSDEGRVINVTKLELGSEVESTLKSKV